MDGEAEVLDQGIETEVPDAEVDSSISEATESKVSESTESQGEEQDAEQSKPADVAKALKTLRTHQDPEIAKLGKLLNDDHFRSQAYGKHGSVQEVAAMAATLARVGGEEGIAKLEGEVNEYSGELADFANGNGRVLDKWLKEAPDGFKKLVPAALNKLYEVDKAAYGRAIAAPMYGTLKNYGIGKILPELQKSADPAAKAAYEVLSEMVGALEEELRNAPRQPDNTETERQSAEWEKIHGAKFNNEISLASNDCLKHQSGLIDKGLASYLKTKPLGKEAKSDMVSGITSEINRILTADEDYQRRTKATRESIRQQLRAGESAESQRKALVSYINAKMDEVAPKAVKTVWNRRYGAVKTAPKSEAPAGKGNIPADIGKRDYWTLKTDEERAAWRAARAKR